MLSKYIKNKKFSDWLNQQLFMTKLIGDPVYYSLILEDHRRYEVLLFDGQIFSYKFFNIIYSNAYKYTFSRHYIEKPKKVNHLIERNNIVECLIKNNILINELTEHVYYKNAKPYESLRQGPEYDSFSIKFNRLDFNNEISILDILNE